MKSILFTAALLLTAQLIALPTPDPVKGSAMIQSKEFTSIAGDYKFSFKFPAGWGMGDMVARPTAKVILTSFLRMAVLERHLTLQSLLTLLLRQMN